MNPFKNTTTTTTIIKNLETQSIPVNRSVHYNHQFERVDPIQTILNHTLLQNTETLKLATITVIDMISTPQVRYI